MVPGALGPMEVQKVESGVSTTLNPLERERLWNEIPSRALGRAGVSQDRAARDMGIPSSQLSRQLGARGSDHLSYRRMGQWQPAVWQEMVLLIIEFFGLTLGLTEQDRRDLELGRAVRQALERNLSR